jgi:hypothetical protein
MTTTLQKEAFPSLVITTVHYLRNSQYAGDQSVTCIVPNRIYRPDGPDGERAADIETALELVFRQCNHVDGTELLSEPEYEGLRSLSVGDVVSFRAIGWHRIFVCEGAGWTEISREERDWLLANISSRDYFGTFAEVKARNN